MNIIMHYPKDQANIAILQKKVAAVHADAVIMYIIKMACPKEQKLKLVNTLINKSLSR